MALQSKSSSVWPSRRDCLVALTTLPGVAAGGPAIAPAVAFHYEAIVPPALARFYMRFDLMVTGAILSAEQTQKLRAAGSARLVAYEWSSAFYPKEGHPSKLAWQTELKPDWLLNREPATGGAAAPGRGAYWYDFGNPALLDSRAAHLADDLEHHGYDGYFFDTLGWEQVPPPQQAEFQRRHRSLDYNKAQGDFLAKLRARIGAKKTIFTNQGYRHAEHLLGSADFDLSESYFTFLDGSGTGLRRWHNPAKPWESVRTPVEQLILPALAKFPGLHFVHANYAQGAPPILDKAIRYGWACAKLWDHSAYCLVPGNAAGEASDLYFDDLGRPKQKAFSQDERKEIAWREYEKGVVAINSGREPATIPGLGLHLDAPPAGYVFR